MINKILKCIATGVSCATVVLLIMDSITEKNALTLLALGLFSLAISSLNEWEKKIKGL